MSDEVSDEPVEDPVEDPSEEAPSDELVEDLAPVATGDAGADAAIVAEARAASAASAQGELWRLLGLLRGDDRGRAREVYEFLGAHNSLGRRSLYVNLGYWAEAETFDDACEALAIQLGEFAELGPGHQVFDAGFGYGDQLLLWLTHFEVARVEARNVTPGQVEVAQRRIEAAGLAARARLVVDSALATDLEAESCDRVLALESAFHFEPRETFFEEAFRVLRPGGVLALADLATLGGDGWSERLLGKVGRRLWQVPEGNLYLEDGFRSRLDAAGFAEVEVRSITAHVFEPFKEYAREHRRDPEISGRVNPLLRSAWGMPTVDRSGLEYYLIRARKP